MYIIDNVTIIGWDFVEKIFQKNNKYFIQLRGNIPKEITKQGYNNCLKLYFADMVLPYLEFKN